MAEDTKAEDVVEQLRDSFQLRIRTALSWLPAHEALQLADALCASQLETLAGLRVRYRSRVEYDAAALTEDWRRGKTIEEIVAAHGVSRATAYRHHPSGRTPRRMRSQK